MCTCGASERRLGLVCVLVHVDHVVFPRCCGDEPLMATEDDVFRSFEEGYCKTEYAQYSHTGCIVLRTIAWSWAWASLGTARQFFSVTFVGRIPDFTGSRRAWDCSRCATGFALGTHGVFMGSGCCAHESLQHEWDTAKW